MKVQLVDRSTRPLQLTALGRRYYEGCQALLEQYDELEASIKNAQRDLAGTVQVAAIYSVGLGDLGEYIKTFADREPGAAVHVEYLHPDRVVEHVLEGAADFGLVSFPQKTSKLVALPWREEEMVVVCAPQHPLARLRAVPLEALDGKPFVHFDRNLTVRRKIDRFFKEQGIAVEVVHEFDNIENIKQAVADGAGAALLPVPSLRREVRAGTLVARPLEGVRFARPVGILVKRGHWLGAAARAFLELLQGKSATGKSDTPVNGNGRAHAGHARAAARKARLKS
jgi:DNA-binding transcriptional LysR family regulator